MANNFRSKTSYSTSTEYFMQEDGTTGAGLGDNIRLEDGTAHDSGTFGGLFSLESLSNTTFYQCPDSTTAMILSMSIINKSDDTVSCIVYLHSSTAETKTVSSASVTETNANVTLFHGVPIPTNTTLEVMGGQKIILQPTDKLILKSNSSNGVDVTMSIMEMT